MALDLIPKIEVPIQAKTLSKEQITNKSEPKDIGEQKSSKLEDMMYSKLIIDK